jgi:hypothetical protein
MEAVSSGPRLTGAHGYHGPVQLAAGFNAVPIVRNGLRDVDGDVFNRGEILTGLVIRWR